VLVARRCLQVRGRRYRHSRWLCAAAARWRRAVRRLPPLRAAAACWHSAAVALFLSSCLCRICRGLRGVSRLRAAAPFALPAQAQHGRTLRQRFSSPACGRHLRSAAARAKQLPANREGGWRCWRRARSLLPRSRAPLRRARLCRRCAGGDARGGGRATARRAAGRARGTGNLRAALAPARLRDIFRCRCTLLRTPSPCTSCTRLPPLRANWWRLYFCCSLRADTLRSARTYHCLPCAARCAARSLVPSTANSARLSRSRRALWALRQNSSHVCSGGWTGRKMLREEERRWICWHAAIAPATFVRADGE